MKVNGTLINYYFHCKRQCYLYGNRLNFEDDSELVKIGRAIHEVKSEKKENSEILIDNIKIDKITKEYLTEVKKSDSDIEASKWQLLFYLKTLKDKGINKKGKLEFIEKNKQSNKVIYVDIDNDLEEKLNYYIKEIENLLSKDFAPDIINKPKCKKCAYYEYCYV